MIPARPAVSLAMTVLGLLAFLGGCAAKPQAANIALRKKVQTLEDEIVVLKRRHDADQAEIAGLRGGTTLPSLPAERLERLFTTAGIELTRLTGGADFDPANPGDEGLKIYVRPFDAAGDAIKASGSFVVELFDLNAQTPRLGRWAFDTDHAKATWNSTFLAEGFVLKCPWQQRPESRQLRVRVTFTDELTGRVFRAERDVNVVIAPSTRPSDG